MSGPCNDGGYTRQYRRLWSHPAFRNKVEAAVFAWLLATAQWRDTCMQTRFGPVRLRRGEVLIAERELAEDFGLARKTLRDLLARMAEMGMIALIRGDGRAPQRAGTILQVCNYDIYQLPADGTSLGTTNGHDEGPHGDRIGYRTGTAKGTGKPQEIRGLPGDGAMFGDRTGTAERTENGPLGDRIGTENKEGKEGEENTCSLRSQAASAAAEQRVPPFEQSARADTPPATDEDAADPSDLFGEAPDPKGKRPTASSLIFSEALPKLVAMTGNKEGSVRGYLGGLRRDFRNDAIIVRTVQDAHLLWLDQNSELSDPKAWVRRTVEARVAKRGGPGGPAPSRPAPAPREIPEEVNGWKVVPLVDKCVTAAGIDLDGLWGNNEFSLLVADALAGGASPEHILGVMRRAVQHHEGIRNLGPGWFRSAFNIRLQPRAA